MKTFFFFFGDRLKNFCEDLFFFFGEHLRFVSLVLGLGLEHSCPWPRERLSSERLSLALASDFFCVLGLGLEPCVLDSTSELSPCQIKITVQLSHGVVFMLYIRPITGGTLVYIYMHSCRAGLLSDCNCVVHEDNALCWSKCSICWY